ncbi:neural cell adhesion molecule L1.1 isoform X2 [Larimichthys crocea]|uniref:neural cell adhesion molecule L1.1 isoform X2 n=1 Tax=Larimichthys crocea TaxID=215358 RepID=UPI000F5FFD7E|nr:neural cell adhesion molecule L1.1 isoform X2 [Larimichthys crocea]
MCVSQRRWTGYRGPCSPALPQILLLLLPLSFLSSTPPFAQGAIQIPKDYKVHNMSQPPVLTEMPTSYTAFSLEDINLPCEASGNPTPTFRWVKDGLPFGSERVGSGTLQAVEEELLENYEGRYRCYASNTLGTAMTQTVEVIVEPHPVLPKQQKVRKRAYVGESIILSCNPPKSSTPPYIHWMDRRMVHIKQDDRVTVGLDGNLYFSNLLRIDSRDDYICNAQYAAARTILPESAVSLTVMPINDVSNGRKPSFFLPTGTHTSVLALREQSITLECLPKGLPTPKVEWKKKDGSLADTSARQENHGRWLYFDSITLEDDGEYECQASNNHGSTSHPFTVTVEAAPYWVKESPNLLYALGETVRLECQAEGIPMPTITWSINGQAITEVDDDPRLSVSGGVLILRDVEYADTAVYQCEASNKHGSILLNTCLYVAELPPQIMSSDGVVYRIIEGGSVMLHCESFGSPRPHITWEGKDGLPLLSDPRVSLLTNGSIEMSDISHGDSGAYTCMVKNTNISITAHLEVYNRTVILTRPQHVRVLRGSSALLDCGFYKDPQLLDYQVVWKKDGYKLQESSPDDKYTVFENGTLKVTNVQSDDNGAYSCEVITSLDHAKAGGSITVVAPPDPPKDLSLSDVQEVTLSWIPGHSHNSPIIEYIVQFREEQHTEVEKWKWEEWRKVPGDFNHLQMNLDPYCTYRFRVIALNEVGSSEPSRPSEHYSTPPAVPSSNPTGVRSDSADPGILIITWDEMDKRSHNGQGFMYKVSWREADGRNIHWNYADVLSPPFVVNNTGTYTPFEIKVEAVNSLGVGPPANSEIGHSGEDKPEKAPTGIAVDVMNATIRVRWNEAQDVRGLLLGYKIYIRRLGLRELRSRRSLGSPHHDEERAAGLEQEKRHKESWHVVVHGTRTSEEVTGLKLFSRYEVSVAAFNSKGESPHSPWHHFITPEGAPGPPASLRFESPTEKSLILYWTPPVETNGILEGYMVQYQEEVENSPVQMEFISDPSVNYFLMDSLDPNSYYTFKVIARTSAGDGPPIKQRAATLLEGVPPSNITIIPSDTTFNLSWVTGERDRNHGFRVRYLRKRVEGRDGVDGAGGQWEESEELNSTAGFYSLTGLQPGTEYRLMIIHGNTTYWQDSASTVGTVPSKVHDGFAAQGWLIGLISAIMLLVLILLILCLIKRSKGGKYAVKDKEDKEVDSEARPMKDETFGEYSDGDEKRSDSQPSLCGESKLGSDDSLAEYGDSVDIQFNEDGSFIGQYSGRGPVPHGNESSGPASPVNAVPPPPIAPSMSSILNRPS